MVGNSLHTLLEAIKSGNTERLTQYLAFSSRFHRYSRRNQQLIFSQCPEATRVASFVKWKEEGYSAMGLIVVTPDQPTGNKARVTAHEWAHEILHNEEARRMR